MTAYYNEIDPYAAAWLRNLIDAGHIAPGDVDTRSIEDVTPDDLRGYAQCHFFAGIGVWSHALRRAGWPDDKPVWTGSCPCQPFSAAGKGAGFADERHLWPAWHYLIEECRPPVVFGEQVASKDGLGWLDLVQADMEAAGYAVGPVDLCAAGIGAPHIRQRLWFVAERLADAVDAGRQLLTGGQSVGILRKAAGASEREQQFGGNSTSLSGMADTYDTRLQRAERLWSSGEERRSIGYAAQRGSDSGLADTDGAGSLPGAHAGIHSREDGAGSWHGQPERQSATDGLADADRSGAQRGAGDDGQASGLPQAERQSDERAYVLERGGPDNGRRADGGGYGASGDVGRPGPTNGHWGAADWLFCRDGKWRPVEPGTFPLAHGAANRVGRLRAYGNAIVAQAAQEVITAYMADEAADLI